MAEFKVGDRVYCKGSDTLNGWATIIKIEGNYKPFLLQFDEYYRIRHNGGGLGKKGHYWWVDVDYITTSGLDLFVMDEEIKDDEDYDDSDDYVPTHKVRRASKSEVIEINTNLLLLLI